MIVHICGTSGSGKTTVVRGLFDMGEKTPLFDPGQSKPIAYQLTIPGLSQPIYVIGSYENVCGGCDSISTQDEICDRVRLFAPLGHVIFEGLLASHLFSRYAMLDRDFAKQGIHYIRAFLDTPLEVCLERVIARREARGVALKPFNPKNTTDKWHDMRSVYDKCVSARPKDWKQAPGYRPEKLDARWLDHLRPVEEVFNWLKVVQ